MPKSSIDYAELAGLRIALYSAQKDNASEVVISWINTRIKYLESK